jgi:MFS transporter, APGE family, 1-arseno-3-phosphoglycerate exporter
MCAARPEAIPRLWPQAHRDLGQMCQPARQGARVKTAAEKASYAAGFGLSFAAGILKGLLPGRKITGRTTQTASQSRSAAADVPTAPAPPSAGPTPISRQSVPSAPAISAPPFSVSGIFVRARDWLRNRLLNASASLRNLVTVVSSRRDGIWEYAIVTMAYWGLTITDGAMRMLVLFQFHLMGYTAFQIASLFLFYEIFGVITNLFGGWIGANFGLRVTLFGGLGIQIAALAMLALLNPSWPAWLLVGYVMFTQALSGIAKDLTKMSAKSSIKAVIPKNADATMYRWVSILTGSKNALKGVGFFVGALLITVAGFTPSLLIMSAGLAYLLHALWKHLPSDLGRTRDKAKFTSMFSMDRRVNILSAARFFLFGARDVWFVVALPVYLSVIFGWSPLVVGAYLALWTIGYGIVQSIVPKFVAAKKGDAPKGYTVFFWSLVLAAVPVAIALALGAGLFPTLSIAGGLAVFGVIFAINSAVHSYMIVHYAESEKVAMTVGFYYMANAGGRLAGTILSGFVYQFAGIVGCLWVSAVFVGASALISTGLITPAGAKLVSTQPPSDDFLLPAFSAA